MAISKLSKAVDRLAEAIGQPASPIQSDAVLQRFEFTFELAWKALRIHLTEEEGIPVSSPKATLKAAFKQGVIETTAESEFLKMLEDRNTSTHVYDESEANEIFVRVRDAHLPAIRSLLNRLRPEQ